MNLTEVTVKYPRGATIFAACCASIFCVLGVIGNLVTILALTRCPKLRIHATTAFVLSLCISDLIFCLVNLPLTASRYINEAWTFGDALCQLFPVLFYGNVAVSVLNMVAITLNRPLPDKRITKREKDDRRLTKLMAIIFICILLCFLPLMIVNVFDDNDPKYPVLHILASVLTWASSVINPFIYAASNRQYRSAYSKLFRIVKSSVAFSDSKQGSRASKEKIGSVTLKPSGASS
ncbi:unnamed protein product [Acanthoscelides obtectus]|uniref:G-protein coupled receptors family 1 profile domain-containing protein n=1 Tax=Acanthoscelides obtectus TaxID=200917 RepID=A0A9P0JSZ1_ACAOB|nr:unnamed protein product [Acanthoscelides obtectus]CAK1627965.1 Protein trapped in endoderm-1 [Acanthoscelides obtectus]